MRSSDLPRLPERVARPARRRGREPGAARGNIAIGVAAGAASPAATSLSPPGLFPRLRADAEGVEVAVLMPWPGYPGACAAVGCEPTGPVLSLRVRPLWR